MLGCERSCEGIVAQALELLDDVRPRQGSRGIGDDAYHHVARLALLQQKALYLTVRLQYGNIVHVVKYFARKAQWLATII